MESILRKIARYFVDEKDSSLNGWFYVVMYFVLTHVFFWKFLVPGQMIFGTDVQNQSYPIQHMAVNQMLESGSLMLWNPYIFSGMPFLASFSFPFFYPGALLFFVLPLGFAMGYEMVLHFFLMGVFMYAFLRRLRLSREAAFVGGLMFMFNAHLVSLVYPGHGGKLFTVTFLPVALMLLDRAFESRRLYNFGLMGLVVGLMFYGGHPQILFYCGIALSLFFVFMAAARYRENRIAGTLKLFGYFAASFAVGALLYAAILLPAVEYRGYTHRGGGVAGASSYQFATSFSIGPEDLLYLVMHDPFGWGKDYGPKIPTTDGIFYRGRQGLRLSIDYLSVFGVVLALIGALFMRNRYTWYFTALFLLSAFLALGGYNPLYYYVYKYVPGFSLFRVPYAIIIIAPACIGALAAFGMEYLLRSKTPEKDKRLNKFMAAGSALALSLLALGIYWKVNAAAVYTWFLKFEWVRQMLWGYYADVPARFDYLLKNLFMMVIVLSISMLFLFLHKKRVLKGRGMVIAAAVFVLADLWPVGWQFIKTVPTSTVDDVFYPRNSAIETFTSDKEGPFRVFSFITGNELLYHRIQSLSGYHPVVLNYYERAIGRMELASPLLDLMNVKYLLLPKKPEYDFKNYPDASARQALAERYELLEGEKRYLYKNRAALPRGFLVNTLWVARSEGQALDVVTDWRFKPGAAAVLTEEPDFHISGEADLSGQKVETAMFSPDKIKFDVKSPADSFMVVSEVWYPGWKAYLDGREVKVYRTDYLVRGVFMPAGEHVLEMVFDPPLFKLGAAVSLVTLALMVWLIGREYMRSRVKKEVA